MRALSLITGFAPMLLAMPAAAQQAGPPPAQAPESDPHAGHDMSTMEGMSPTPGQPTPSAEAPDPHAGHDMSAMPGMAADDAAQPRGTDLPPGDAPAPAPPTDHYADRIYPAGAMAPSRAMLTREHGGSIVSQVIFNVAEFQIRDGRNGYRWDGEAWIGSDANRFVLKSEGEGTAGDRVEHAEVQGLYSRPLDPYWNLQVGVRQDLGSGPSRTYATIGIEGLAPYWFEVDGSLFLSTKGDLFARAGAYYDQRITQRLVLQPRVEFNFAAQDVPESRIGSGLSNAEIGLRLRYEIRREFAPYIGISYDRRVGDTARYARLDGKDVENTSLVMGVRFWF
jgi:copper resistance protein B